MRYALRRLLHDRVFTVVAVATLGLGIGANTAIFSLIKSVMLRPLPYGAPGDVVVIWDATKIADTTHLSASEIKSYGEVEGLWLGGYLESNANFTGGVEPERTRTAWVTTDLFDILRVAPLHGRTFRPADATADDTLILGHGLWLRRFGGSPDAIGSAIELGGRKRTVVGVMPEGFRLPLDFRSDRPTEAWLPIALDHPGLAGWGNRSIVGVGRLRDGFTAGAVRGQLHAKSDEWIRAGYVKDAGDGQFRNRAALPALDLLTADARRLLYLLLATVVVVLLIAIANVVNLSTARAEIHRRELAIRLALGARRAELVRQMLIESLVLAGAGAMFGLGLAWTALRVLSAFRPANLPRAAEASIDPGVLAFTALLAVAAGLLLGIVPAIRGSRPDLTTTLHDGGRGGTAGRARQIVRGALVVSQVAMSVVLVLSAGLLTRSLIALTRVDPGFETKGILTAQITLTSAAYPRDADVVAFYRQVIERLEQLPGVEAAGAIRIIPLTRNIGDWSITIEGQVRPPNENPNGDFQWATPGYFSVLGLRVIEGRPLDHTDREDTQPVVVINDTMAARYWPGEPVLGRRFRMGTGDTPWMTVVGVVATSRHDTIVEAPRAEMYLPHAQLPRTVGSAARSMALVLKTRANPLARVDGLKAVIRALDPNLPVSEIQTMEQVLAKALSQPRFATGLLVIFAGLAVVLAAVGIYGMLSLLVSERSQEIGIRMALGAGRGAILRMVLGRSLVLAVIGIAAGLAAAALLTPLIDALLYDVEPLDPLTFSVVPVVLLAVALAGSLAPARRASNVDPAIALRS